MAAVCDWRRTARIREPDITQHPPPQHAPVADPGQLADSFGRLNIQTGQLSLAGPAGNHYAQHWQPLQQHMHPRAAPMYATQGMMMVSSIRRRQLRTTPGDRRRLSYRLALNCLAAAAMARQPAAGCCSQGDRRLMAVQAPMLCPALVV
jgi:hypothetical protein